MFQDFIPLQLETIGDFADPIPGCVETIESLKSRGIKIGSSTGYTREMMDILVPAAKALGYETDVDVCASDVPAGRPAPWMLFENMKRPGRLSGRSGSSRSTTRCMGFSPASTRASGRSASSRRGTKSA